MDSQTACLDQDIASAAAVLTPKSLVVIGASERESVRRPERFVAAAEAANAAGKPLVVLKVGTSAGLGGVWVEALDALAEWA